MALGTFYPYPKALDTDPKYKHLSLDAKYIYVRLRDIYRLSLQNGWRDREGVFVRVSREKIASYIHKSLPTVRKVIAELIACGLLREKRVGLTQCNKLYVQLLDGEEESDFLPGEKTHAHSAKKQGFSPDRKAPAANNTYPTKRNYNNNDCSTRWGQKTVLAQQYTQRDYTHEQLMELVEKI